LAGFGIDAWVALTCVFGASDCRIRIRNAEYAVVERIRCLGELRQLHLAINQTLARIKTDVPEASGMMGGVNQGRRAANIRWRGRGA
jgi:hypothetical protein